MTREEKLDWLYRLKSEIDAYMPKEWIIPMNNALDAAIKALEQEATTKNDLAHNLCDSCINIGCEFQSGILRTECAFYMPPHIEPDNCGNYIVQDSIKTELKSCKDIAKAFQFGMAFGFCEKNGEIDKLIDKAKTITPQSKTGHWIWCVGSHKCSNCEEYTCFSFKKPPRYCPNCGAKMIEPQETETWNGIHGQITAPKGTFEQIFNDTDDDNDI